MKLSHILLIFLFISISACSLYESDGHKAIEKDSGGLVTSTSTGVNLQLNLRYECAPLVALPVAWQKDITSLTEYSKLEGSRAVLLASETPTVVVYAWVDRYVESCALAILDNKLSTQNLRDVVEFGESLLIENARR